MSLTKLLFVPDAHRPYHNKKAWELMIRVGRNFRPDKIIVLGDFADFYSVSSFSKDPNRALQLDVEVKSCNAGLDELDALGAKQKFFIAGNHCYRLEKYLKDRAPALFSSLRVEVLFKLEKRRWKYIAYRQDVKIGKLYFTHDVDTYARHAAFKAMDTYQHSIITGHSHRLIYIVENDAIGTPLLSAQFGWLGDVSQVDYTHRIKAQKNWALGFGIAYEEEESGLIFCQPVPIVEGKCVVEGKLYK